MQYSFPKSSLFFLVIPASVFVKIQHTLNSHFIIPFSNIFTSPISFSVDVLIYSQQYCHVDVKMHWIDLLSGDLTCHRKEEFSWELKQVKQKIFPRPRCCPLAHPDLILSGVQMCLVFQWKTALNTLSVWNFSVCQFQVMSAAKVGISINQENGGIKEKF